MIHPSSARFPMSQLSAAIDYANEFVAASLDTLRPATSYQIDRVDGLYGPSLAITFFAPAR